MTMPSLPDELIDRILTQFDARSIARMETVSRQWHRVARNNQSLWREVLCLNEKKDDEKENNWHAAEEIAQCIDAQLLRSGGRLDRLTFSLVLPYCDADDVKPFPDVQAVKHIFKLLPQMQVKELHARLSEVGRSPSVLLSTEPMVRCFIDALEQCAHLEVLRLDEWNRLYMRFNRSFANTPLSTCSLRQLHIAAHWSSVDDLLSDNSLLRMIRTATHISVRLEQSCIWPVLEAAHETLESADLRVSICREDGNAAFPGWTAQPRAAQPRRPIHFPKLQKLSIEFDEGDDTQFSTFAPALTRKLICPALNTLQLHDCSYPVSLIKSFFGGRRHGESSNLATQSLPSLQSLQFRVSNDDALIGLAGFLDDCCRLSLRNVTIEGGAHTFIEELTYYQGMNFDELRFKLQQDALRQVTPRQVCQLIWSRMGSPGARPFRTITFDSYGLYIINPDLDSTTFDGKYADRLVRLKEEYEEKLRLGALLRQLNAICPP